MVIVSSRAKKQMRRRKIQPKQMYEVLMKVYVVEHAARDLKGCWKCTLEYLTAGERVKVAAALCQDENHGTVVVVTVMN